MRQVLQVRPLPGRLRYRPGLLGGTCMLPAPGVGDHPWLPGLRWPGGRLLLLRSLVSQLYGSHRGEAGNHLLLSGGGRFDLTDGGVAVIVRGTGQVGERGDWKKGNGGERRPGCCSCTRAPGYPPPVSAAPLPAPLGRKKFKSFVFSYYIYSTTTSCWTARQVTY